MSEEIYSNSNYGYQLNYGNQPVQDNTGKPKKKKKGKGAIVALIIIIILAAAVAGIYLYFTNKNATPQNAYIDLLTEIEKDPENFFKGIDEISDYNFSELDIEEDEFAVVDIDSDSVPELIINIKSIGEDYSFSLVYGYTKNDGAVLRGEMTSDPEFYTGGIVVSRWNIEGSGREITLIEEYDKSTMKYTPVFRYYESESGTTYYAEEYVGSQPGNAKEYTYDELAEYLDSSYLNGKNALVIDYDKINVGNIDKISSEGTVTAATNAGESTSAVDADYQRTRAEAMNIKVGFICLHDENSADDYNYLTALETVCNEMNVEYIEKTNIDESDECYETAVELVEEGCTIIFSNSCDYEDYIIQAATEYPDVQFCQIAGVKAHTERLPNYHNAYAAIHEGRYLTGVAAGMKINEMIENGDINEDEAVIGFVGSYNYAEVISSYTAFYLGAKSVCESVTMKVRFTYSEDDESTEKSAADRLINGGCCLISQYGESGGAPVACEEQGVPNVAYGNSEISSCPNTYVVSTKINWQPYFEYAIGCIIDGEAIDTDWTGDLETGSVEICEINDAEAASGTAEAIETAKEGIINGTVKVFDTSNFTQYSREVETYYADVDYDSYNRGDTEVIVNGQFKESVYRSYPYFDLKIDGITRLNG